MIIFPRKKNDVILVYVAYQEQKFMIGGSIMYKELVTELKTLGMKATMSYNRIGN